MSTTSAVHAKQASRALGLYAWGVVGYNILVILWGAVVRATGSGAGCGDNWPLCNGDFFPHHPRLATIIEFAHRSMTGVATALVVGLLVWTLYATKRGDRARRPVIASMVFLVTEALLGAVLVLGGYVQNNISTARVVMQSIHFTNTMLLLASLALTAWWLGDDRRTAPTTTSKTTGPAWLAVVATIVMGATGSVAALADTLFPSQSLGAALASDFAAHSPLLIRMRWMHPAAALIGACCVLWLIARTPSRLARIVAGLLALQFFLGIGDVLLLAPTWMQVVHLLGADLYWVALVCLAGEAVWGRPDSEEPARHAHLAQSSASG